jgi:hypothetical protein
MANIENTLDEIKEHGKDKDMENTDKAHDKAKKHDKFGGGTRQSSPAWQYA